MFLVFVICSADTSREVHVVFEMVMISYSDNTRLSHFIARANKVFLFVVISIMDNLCK